MRRLLAIVLGTVLMTLPAAAATDPGARCAGAKLKAAARKGGIL